MDFYFITGLPGGRGSSVSMRWEVWWRPRLAGRPGLVQGDTVAPAVAHRGP